MNTSKRAITLNLETETGRVLLQRLLPTTDIVLESFAPGTLGRWGLDFDTLQPRYPHLIMTSITAFGQTGPYSAYRATDLEVLALGGFLATCGEADRAPMRISLPQSNLFASVSAFTGTMLAYYHRLRGGQGQHVDVAMQECATNLHYAQLTWHTYGIITPRLGSTLWFGNYIPMDLTTPAWQERLQTLATTWTQEQVDHASEVVAAFLAGFTKETLYAEAVQRRIMLYPVQTVRDCLADRQLQARAYFVQVQSPGLPRPLLYPGAPFRLSATPWQIRGPAPRLGEHNAAIYGNEFGLSVAERAALQQEGVI
jgi:crotonobetainyl-CoA:carnitine CoA-transferase CaiB-like acyl-CoA transferase